MHEIYQYNTNDTHFENYLISIARQRFFGHKSGRVNLQSLKMYPQNEEHNPQNLLT